MTSHRPTGPTPETDSPSTVSWQDDSIEVLFVAGETDWSETVATVLRDQDSITVTHLTDPARALERFDAGQEFECLVGDFESFETRGVEFIERAGADVAAVPFLLCVSGDAPQRTREALRAGADDVVQKQRVEQCQTLLTRRITTCVTAARQEQSFETLRRAVESAGHAVLITDERGVITYVNQSMVDVSGYTAAELVGQTPSILKSGEHDEAFYAELWETILDGEVWHGEVINEHKHGGQYVIDQTIAPITDAAGSITGFIAINREVSDRVERERTLAFFEQAVDQIGTGMAAYTEDGIIEYANQAYADMLGTTPRALHGIHVASLNPEFDPDRFDEYWDSFDTRETKRAETIHRRLDTDETFPVDTVTTHIAVDDEEYHIGTIRDVTERREREQELRLFRQAVEHAGHAVIITDSEGVIEYVNPAFTEMTGYTSDEALGETPAILKSGAHDEAFYAELWETILDGEVWDGEVINEDADGARFHIEQTIAPLTDEEGTVTHFVGINNDITEMKEYERELERQNERLEQFGESVAHELRNPLNTVRIHLREAQSADDATQAHEEIAEAVGRMQRRIDELLMLAKQGRTVIDPSPVSLADLAQTAWSHVQTGAMTLTVTDSPTLSVDETRVVELLENLFRNAREHAGADAHVRVGVCQDGFYVADDGPGIPQADRDRVLESGFSTSDEGTGFGLSIVKQIATAHDWTLTVSESESGGARFEFHTDTPE